MCLRSAGRNSATRRPFDTIPVALNASRRAADTHGKFKHSYGRGTHLRWGGVRCPHAHNVGMQPALTLLHLAAFCRPYLFTWLTIVSAEKLAGTLSTRRIHTRVSWHSSTTSLFWVLKNLLDSIVRAVGTNMTDGKVAMHE